MCHIEQFYCTLICHLQMILSINKSYLLSLKLLLVHYFLPEIRSLPGNLRVTHMNPEIFQCFMMAFIRLILLYLVLSERITLE